MPIMAVGLRVVRGPDWKWMDQDYKCMLFMFT